MSRLRVVLLCAAAAVLFGGLPAVATVSRTADLATESRFEAELDNNAVAVDRQGDALAVYTRRDSNQPSSWSRVELRRRPAGGSWSKAVNATSGFGIAFQPTIAVDDDGDGVLVFQATDGQGNQITFGRRVTRGGFLGPVRMISRPGINAWGAGLAVDGDGDATITWSTPAFDAHGNAIGNWVEYRRWETGELPGAIRRPGALGDVAAVATDREGHVILAWPHNETVSAMRVAPDGTAGAPVVVGGSPEDGMVYDYDVAVTMASPGRALVVWDPQGPYSPINPGLTAVLWPAGGAPRSLGRVTPAGEYGTEWGWHLAGTPSGQATLLWGPGGSSPYVATRQIRADGSLGPGTWLGAGELDPAVMAASPDNGMVLVWAAQGQGHYLRLQPDGTRYGPIQPMTTVDQDAIGAWGRSRALVTGRYGNTGVKRIGYWFVS